MTLDANEKSKPIAKPQITEFDKSTNADLIIISY